MVRGFGLLLGLVLLGRASAQDTEIPLEIQGADVRTVKVDKIIVTKVDRLLVNGAFKLKAPAGGILYQWQYPSNWTVVRKGPVLEVVTAMKGYHTVTAEYAVVDFDKRTVDTKYATISFDVGEITPPPPPPKPPDPPVPPLPDTPLSRAIREVLLVETAADLARLGDLVDVYRKGAAAALEARVGNAKALNDLIRSSREARIGSALPNARAVINQYLTSIFNSTAPFTDESRKTCRDALIAVADALQKAGGV